MNFYVLGLGVSVFFEPLGIIIAVLLATGLAFYFEMRAEREFAVLTQVNDDIPVRVVRNGHNHSVPPSRHCCGRLCPARHRR